MASPTISRKGSTASIAILAVMAAAFIALAVLGAWRWYSPVPFWDMWDGYLTYYINAQRFSFWKELFGQANEHRVPLSRLLFWLDIRFFGGRSLLLISANVVLLSMCWLTLCVAARRLIADKTAWLTVCLAIVPLCFSWLQKDNITVGYQTQFFFAYLLALLSFVSLALALDGKRSTLWFATALVFGLLACGGMANGLTVLPFLMVMMGLAGARRWWIAIAGAVWLVAVSAWFYEYTFIAREISGLGDIAGFVLAFMGVPLGGAVGVEAVSRIAGMVFIALALTTFIEWWHGRVVSRDFMSLALITFVGYVGASALVTAIGRAGLEPYVVHAGRYATPPLLAWAALGVVLAARFSGARARTGIAIAGIVMALLLLPAQTRTLGEGAFFETAGKAQGALALLLGVNDTEAMEAVYPVSAPDGLARLQSIVKSAEGSGVSLFSDAGGYLPAVRRLGYPPGADLRACAGQVDEIVRVKTDPTVHMASGWAFETKDDEVPDFVYLVADGIVAGVGISGLPRPDVARIVDRRARAAGFRAYIKGPPAPPYAVMCNTAAE
jgi:hypothetical protein